MPGTIDCLHSLGPQPLFATTLGVGPSDKMPAATKPSFAYFVGAMPSTGRKTGEDILAVNEELRSFTLAPEAITLVDARNLLPTVLQQCQLGSTFLWVSLV